MPIPNSETYAFASDVLGCVTQGETWPAIVGLLALATTAAITWDIFGEASPSTNLFRLARKQKDNPYSFQQERVLNAIVACRIVAFSLCGAASIVFLCFASSKIGAFAGQLGMRNLMGYSEFGALLVAIFGSIFNVSRYLRRCLRDLDDPEEIDVEIGDTGLGLGRFS